MNTVLTPVVHDDLSPLGARALDEVLSVLHDFDDPARVELVEALVNRFRSYDRISRLEMAWDDMRELVRAAPFEIGMGMVSATEACDASCRIRSFWRHLVSSVLGEDLSFGVPPIH